MEYDEGDEYDGWRIADEVLEWIEETIPLACTILELGSGRGSHILAKNGYRVVSVEHNEKWLNMFPGVEYIHAPIKEHKPVAKFSGGHDWYDKEVIASIKHDYSLIIVDGPPGNFGRSGFFKYLDLFKKNVPIIFDDLHRDHELMLARRVSAKLRKPLVMHCWNEKQWGYIL